MGILDKIKDYSSRAYDQVNMFDKGKSWGNQTPQAPPRPMGRPVPLLQNKQPTIPQMSPQGQPMQEYQNGAWRDITVPMYKDNIEVKIKPFQKPRPQLTILEMINRRYS